MSAHPLAHGDEPGFRRDSTPALFNLVYCSRASAGVDQSTVDHIIGTARRFNAQHAITGMLVFGSGVFFQWLEGPRDNVLALMAKLKTDPRHHEVIMLNTGEEVRERLFPDWDMELVSSDHIREVLLDAQTSATDPTRAAALGRLLVDLDSGVLAELGA